VGEGSSCDCAAVAPCPAAHPPFSFALPSLTHSDINRNQSQFIHRISVSEVVHFLLREEALHGFHGLSSAMGAFLATRKGFISRTVMKDVNNPLLFIDIVVWASLNDATGAANAVEEEVSTAPFLQAIEKIISTSHYTVKR
jgi:hypothetical protein